MAMKITDDLTYIRTGRDLARYINVAEFTTASRNAFTILINDYIPLMEKDIISCVMEKAMNIAKESAIFHSKQIHRYPRPEECAFVLDRYRETILSKELDVNSYILNIVSTTSGCYLLPQAYPTGAPLTPSFPSVDAAVIGASTTILKAFFDEDTQIMNPVITDDSGQNLKSYNKNGLTIGGELNKLASNIGYAGIHAGIHHRQDVEAGIYLGEKVAIRLLEELKELHELNNMKLQFKFQFKRRNGDKILI